MKVNAKNLGLILILVLANAAAFVWGGYYVLNPILFIAGFAVICGIGAYASNSWKTGQLIALALSATLLGFIDEYAHTSVGTLTYFDHAVPSLLTVFGWSVFMIFLMGAAVFSSNIPSFRLNDIKKLRTAPVFVVLVLILAVVLLQDFLSTFNWFMLILYLFLFGASFYYNYFHPLKLNLMMLLLSLGLGLAMEYTGGMQGLWTFRFDAPVSLLILFSWPLRFWAVASIASAFGFDFGHPEKSILTMSPELDKAKSLIVVADTHFGLNKENEHSNPCAFDNFVSWLNSISEKGGEKLSSGSWSTKEDKSITVQPPEKMIFLGDILEMWDASKESIDVCTRSIVQSLSVLKAEKIYILGNHDQSIDEISDSYPLGASNIQIMKGEYATQKGGRKFVFVHGHEFDKLFNLPSWRVIPYINNAASVFGRYSWLFVVFFALDLALLITPGYNSVGDWLIFLLLSALSVPFVITLLWRKAWNKMKTTKYKPQDAEIGLAKWWGTLKRETIDEPWTVVYGHTHVIGIWNKNICGDNLTLFNLPSWVKDTSEKSGVQREMIFRNAFLYIDGESVEFFGWDSEKKKPFLVPKELIEARLHSKTIKEAGLSNIEEKLRELDWPQKLIDKWVQHKFETTALA